MQLRQCIRTLTYGKINLSLINCQMIRVISSPSISTTGFAAVNLFCDESVMEIFSLYKIRRDYSICLLFVVLVSLVEISE